MEDVVTALSQSDDWSQRVRAARLVARSGPGEREDIVLRLLRDPGSDAVRAAMVAALLEARREGAIRLILRSLGEPEDRGPDETGQRALEGLLSSELDGIDVRGGIISVLRETDDRQELLGALRAIGWLTPSGGFPAPPEALAYVTGLANDADAGIRAAAQTALTALGDSWRQPDLEA
jgi:HEAT repeat protein